MTEYREKQRFRQWWIWLVITSVLCILCWAVIQQLILGIEFGNHPASDIALFIITGFVFLIMGLFVFSVLETRVDKAGIHYRYFPFLPKQRTVLWEEIEKIMVREHKPVSEYGGWGIRGSKKNRALTVSGRSGMQIFRKNGRKLFIGTQNPTELAEALRSLNKI